MRIDRLEVRNFKKFKDQAFELHPHFTLLIGENGSGKTSVLDALAVAMGVWLVRPPDSLLRNSGRKILPSELRLESKKEGDRIQFREVTPASVTANGIIAGQEGIQWTRSNSGGTLTVNLKAREALQIIEHVYLKDRRGERVICPVLAYYGAGRGWLPSRQRILKDVVPSGPARRWAAFYDCFNERIRFDDLNNWFKKEAIEAGNRRGKPRPGYETVKRAVLDCVPGADHIFFSSDQDQIVLSIDGNAQPFDNLSAGQRMMLALVADLAIKAVTQNAFLLPPDELGPDDHPLPRLLVQTPGVVLIDELDVHLHPKWQRRVAADLKRTFPSIQFVCTSHSPQVIGEVPRDEVLVLDDEGVRRPSVALGADSNWLLNFEMGAQSRNEEAAKLVRGIEDALEEPNLGQARARLEALRSLLGGEDGETVRLESTIHHLEALARAED